jgi:VanZ family protein
MARQPLATTLRLPATLLLAAYWICLFIGTHIPQPERLISPNVWDKGLHMAAYAGLTSLILLNMLLRGPLRWSRLAMVLAAVAVVGMFDELTQIPVGRNCDVLDLAADVTGALAATLAIMLAVAAFRRPGTRLPRA